MIVFTITSHFRTFAKKRHVQARRRLTMSSSRSLASSVPKRLGHGMIRRTMMSTMPRKATTAKKVRSSDFPTPQLLWWWNQKKTAGLVASAMSVATRVSRRHSFESAACVAMIGDWVTRFVGVPPAGGVAVALLVRVSSVIVLLTCTGDDLVQAVAQVRSDASFRHTSVRLR